MLLGGIVALHQERKQADGASSVKVRRQGAAGAWCVSTAVNEQMTHIIR